MRNCNARHNPSVTPLDRDYFMMRAQTEAQAAAHSEGLVRARHEEFAVAYQMRVMCIDKGYADAPTGPLEPAPAAEAMPQMIVLA